MKSRRTKEFKRLFKQLPSHIQEQAKDAYRLFQENPHHPSLQFKCLNRQKGIYSARVGLRYRVLGIREGNAISWYFIGSHEDYNNLSNR